MQFGAHFQSQQLYISDWIFAYDLFIIYADLLKSTLICITYKEEQ